LETGARASILTGSDSFEFVYRVRIPKLEDRASLWLPVAESDNFQEVTLTAVEGPVEGREIRDRDFGNRILYFALGAEDSDREIVLRYEVLRREKSSYQANEPELMKYLRAERLTPLHGGFKRIAEEAIAGKSGQWEQAFALYNHVLGLFRYDKSGVGWGRGDALYACDVKTGNCTDFHSYFIGLSRSVGIPARFAIGATIPAGRAEGPIAGYHCWAEFYADGKWVPVDISEAWKFPALSDYYFGNHPANRIEFSLGRDLVVDPLPPNGPINFLVYPIFEEHGNERILVPELSFKRIKRDDEI
jgi:transglutaminase-like putative cysteine protease